AATPTVESTIGRREHDWKAEGPGRSGDRNDVADEEIPVHRRDNLELERLVVDDHEGTVLRGEQVVDEGVANRLACPGNPHSRGIRIGYKVLAESSEA